MTLLFVNKLSAIVNNGGLEHEHKKNKGNEL